MTSTIARYLALLLALALAAAGCRSDSEVAPEDEAPAEVAPISGLYRVSGHTAPAKGGRKRAISGTIVLTDQGDSYTASFNLTTVYPGEGEDLPADVIGHGEGTIEGRTLRGTAQTQLVVTTVPGVDPAFAYIPRTVTTRLVSTTMTTLTPEGGVSIEIENVPAPGEEYVPTRTKLMGNRISAAGLGGDAGPESPLPAGEES